jgi:hypothetical protein
MDGTGMNGLEKDIAYYRQLLLRYNNDDRHLKEIRGIRKRIVNIIDTSFKGETKQEWMDKVVQIEVETVQPVIDYDDDYQRMNEYYDSYKKTGNADDGIECWKLKTNIYQSLMKKYDPDIDITTFAKYKMILLIDIDYPKLLSQSILQNWSFNVEAIVAEVKEELTKGSTIDESFDKVKESGTKKIINIMDWKKKND